MRSLHTRVLTLALLLLSPAVAQESLQLPLVADTYVRKGNTNQGDAAVLLIRKAGDHRALVRFDDAALLQALQGGTLLSASLELTIASNGNDWGAQGRSLDLHLMTQAWSELEATWSQATASTSWDMTAGEAYASTPSTSTTIGDGQSGAVTLDVTADVQAFLAGSLPNHGWLLRKTDESQNGTVEFGSRESATPGRLLISYTAVCETPAGIAHPSSSTTGAYQVTWGAAPYPAGCTYVLEESVDGAGFVQVAVTTDTFADFSGRSNGSYLYRVKATHAGYLDSAYVSSPSPLVVSLVNGPVSFGDQRVYSCGESGGEMDTGDFNEDGKTDVVIRGRNNQYPAIAVRVYYQTSYNGVPDLGPLESYTLSSSSFTRSSLAVGDVSGDGLLDVVTPVTGGLAVFHQAQGAMVHAQTLPSANNGYVALGDLDGDGDLDLVSIGTSQIEVRLQGPAGTFAAPTVVYLYAPSSPGWTDLELGDFNNDGRLDLIALDGTYGQGPVVLLQNPGGGFAAPVAYTNPLAARSRLLVPGDVSGDGLDDVVVAHDYPSYLSVQLQGASGLGSLQASTGPEPLGYGVTVGDVNADGRPDVVYASSAGLQVLYNVPGGLDPAPPVPIQFGLTYVQQVKVADVNDDGKADVLVMAPGQNALVVLHQQ